MPSQQCFAIQFTCKDGRYIIVGIQIWCVTVQHVQATFQVPPELHPNTTMLMPAKMRRAIIISHSLSQSLGDSGALQHPHVWRAMLHQFITFPPPFTAVGTSTKLLTLSKVAIAAFSPAPHPFTPGTMSKDWWRAAHIKGVQPSSSWTFTSAPSSMAALTASTSLFRTATCNSSFTW